MSGFAWDEFFSSPFKSIDSERCPEKIYFLSGSAGKQGSASQLQEILSRFLLFTSSSNSVDKNDAAPEFIRVGFGRIPLSNAVFEKESIELRVSEGAFQNACEPGQSLRRQRHRASVLRADLFGSDPGAS